MHKIHGHRQSKVNGTPFREDWVSRDGRCFYRTTDSGLLYPKDLTELLQTDTDGLIWQVNEQGKPINRYDRIGNQWVVAGPRAF